MMADNIKKVYLDNNYRQIDYRNQDESFIRSVIVSTILHLKQVKYIYVDHKNKTVSYIDLPIMYAYTDRQLYSDFFTNLPPNCPDNFIETDYNVYPRMVINLTSIDITSNWSGGIDNIEIEQIEYDQNKNVIQTRYAIKSLMLPVTLNFNASVITKSVIKNFIIIESVFSYLYDSNKFDFYYKGINVQCNILLSDTNINIDNKQKISFNESNNEYKSEFKILVQTHMPLLFIDDRKKISEYIIKRFDDRYHPE